MTRDYRPATLTSIKNAKSRLTASPVSDRGERTQSIIFPFSSARLVRLLLRKRLVNGSFGGDSSLFPLLIINVSEQIPARQWFVFNTLFGGQKLRGFVFFNRLFIETALVIEISPKFVDFCSLPGVFGRLPQYLFGMVQLVQTN